MSNTVISVENLSKAYRLGQIGTGTLTNDLKVWWAKKRGLPNPLLKVGQTDHGNRDGETLWALKDVNLTIEQGEVLGIIGRNGAGKSTLLKILSRVTAPTSGCVNVKGRIASLLEVGTGFHPELTGKENIFLNGAILGMNKEEVRRKFDEIVAFAEVEKFIDTPVKRYSSGMYVRLAFAVAAHLESEILVVDEVLAVGDAEFQKKCLGKMGDVAREGRTVLFVSHNMSAIDILCNRAMILINGRNSSVGNTKEIIRSYLTYVKENISIPLDKREDRKGLGQIKFIDVKFDGINGTNCFNLGDDIKIQFKIKNNYRSQITARFSLSVRTTNEVGLISCDSDLISKHYLIKESYINELECKIICPPLNIGEYYVNIAIYNGMDIEDWLFSAANFSIISGNYDNRVNQNNFPILSKFEWTVKD